jgi:single stranded DNA-binding protein
MFNKIIVSGICGKDPEIKYFESGKVKTSFSIAVNGFKDGQKITSWFDIDTWDRQAEMAAEYVKKGKNVSVEGHLYSHEYNNKKHWRITANKVTFSYSGMVGQGTIVDIKTIANGDKVFNNLILQVDKDQIAAMVFSKRDDLGSGVVVNFFGEVQMIEYIPMLVLNKCEVA